jgi:hypothetical protein
LISSAGSRLQGFYRSPGDKEVRSVSLKEKNSPDLLASRSLVNALSCGCFVDIVILRGGSLEILGGNGDGTFATARVIDNVDPLRELQLGALRRHERRWTPRPDRAG